MCGVINRSSLVFGQIPRPLIAMLVDRARVDGLKLTGEGCPYASVDAC